MSSNSRILDRFTGYTLEDCACEYCLYHTRKGCAQEVCCCAEEKKQAIERAASTARKTS